MVAVAKALASAQPIDWDVHVQFILVSLPRLFRGNKVQKKKSWHSAACITTTPELNGRGKDSNP